MPKANPFFNAWMARVDQMFKHRFYGRTAEMVAPRYRWQLEYDMGYEAAEAFQRCLAKRGIEDNG